MTGKGLIVWACTLLFAFTFVNCSKDDDDDNSNNIIAQEYFKVEKGNFSDKTLPTGDVSLIRTLTTPKTVVKNGTPLITISSSYKLEKVFIGVSGRTGYYEVNKVEPTDIDITTTNPVYYYQFQLKISETIERSSFAISVSAEGIDGLTSRPLTSEVIYVSGVGSSENLLEVDYFSVRNGSYRNGILPTTGEGSFFSYINIPTSVQKGGSAVIAFASQEKLTKVYVTANGYTDGYYEQTITEHLTTGGNHYYEVSLNISEYIAVNRFQLQMVVETESKYLSAIYTSNNISVTEPIVGNPVEKYFTVKDASFVSDFLPVGSEELVSAEAGTNVINGGTSRVYLTSSTALQKIYVGVAGTVGGYYEQTPTLLGLSGGNYSYEVILNINQTISGSFKLELSALTPSGVTKKYTSNSISVTYVNSQNPIEENYFTVENGTFVRDFLPSGNNQLIQNLSLNQTVINGGSARVSFTSIERFKKIFVSVADEPGYYEQVVETYETTQTSSGNAYLYEMLLMINQEINFETFRVCVSAETEAGVISKQENSDPINVIEAGTGDLQITLSWDQNDDLDLHVVDPYGIRTYFDDYLWVNGEVDEFYFYFSCYLITKYTSYNVNGFDYNNYSHRNLVTTYIRFVDISDEQERADILNFINDTDYEIHAFLDIDSNAACEIDGIRNENIYFVNPDAGTYHIYVNLWEKCQSYTPGAKYDVTINYQGQSLRVEQGAQNQSGQLPQSNKGNYNDESKYIYIGSFTIPGSRAGVTVKKQEEAIFKNLIRDKFRKK